MYILVSGFYYDSSYRMKNPYAHVTLQLYRELQCLPKIIIITRTGWTTFNTNQG